MNKLTQQQQRALSKLLRSKKPVAVVCGVVIVLILLGTSLVTGGLTSEQQESDSTPSGALSSTSASSSPTTAETEAASSQLETVQVDRVVDGDTLVVYRADGSTQYVRLIGVDAPESVASDESRNCEEGVIASNYLKSTLSSGDTVWLQRDVSDTDKYGRLLRYVWLEEPADPTNEEEIKTKMLNALLVQEGYVQVKRYKPDTTLHDMFTQWGNEALRAGKGVTHKWAS